MSQPLVTFAIFAYNQEDFISEAVQGAFSQTYEPLEIILSDDCSSDRTFYIMQDLVAQYQGNARIIVRRSSENRGLLKHIADVVDISTGEFLVVAAGDDISLPDRTSEITNMIQAESSEFAASNFTQIGERGETIGENLTNDYSGHYLWTLVNESPDFFANGAAACYRTSFLRSALQSIRNSTKDGKVNHEDMLFSAYGVAIGAKPSNYTKKPLILYRINKNSISNYSQREETFHDELVLLQREIFRSSSRFALLLAIKELASKYPRLNDRINCDVLNKDMRRAQIEMLASDSRIWMRISALMQSRSKLEIRVSLSRLFGVRFLSMMRYFKKNFKKSIEKKS